MGEIIRLECRSSRRTAIIVGAAPCSRLDYLAPYRSEDDVIICADGGRRNAEAAGLKPDWYVGDGDSGGSPEGLPSMVLPTEKDFTDLEVAIHQAFRMGCTRMVLCACTGGRADHGLANYFLLEQIHEAGGEGILLDEVNELRLIYPGTFSIDNQPEFRYIGLIPADRQLDNVTLRGVKYQVEQMCFRRTATLGVSNEFLPGQTAEITIGGGRGFLIRSEPVGR